jgi:glycosyltransferase involved in cell wall biosynthesis
MKVSVYIPVYNAERYLDRTLTAVCQQTRPFDEIIVIDDGSCDSSAQLIAKYNVRLITHGHNKGLGAARNSGIKAASYELVAAVDADCVIDKDWLLHCLPFFDDPAVSGVGGMMEESFVSAVDYWRACNLVQHFGEGVKKVPYLAGSNVIFKKRELISIGLYDENFLRNHEDTDMSKRVIENGGCLIYAPQAKATHIKEDTLFSVMRSCWGFRHVSFPQTLVALIIDLFKEAGHTILMIGRTMYKGRWRLLPIDAAYFFMQCYFSYKSYVSRTAHF